MKKSLLAGFAAMALSLATFGSASASAYLPYGPQNDVPISTVTGGGWTVVYSGDYGATASYDQLFGNIAPGSYVMFAGSREGSTNFDVLAWAPFSDVTATTGTDQTHAANGAEWYYNNSSMGFAGAGDQITQLSADVWDYVLLYPDWSNMDQYIPGLERDRLSWHRDYWNADFMQGGWRSGNNVWLNDSTDWDRYVLAYNPDPIPEPSTWVMLASGLAGLAFYRRKRAAAA